jgi:hypothetical protein
VLINLPATLNKNIKLFDNFTTAKIAERKLESGKYKGDNSIGFK